MKYLSIVVLLLSYCLPAHAALHTAKIKRVGCHINNDVCFAYIEGTITSSCPSNDNSFRWSSTGPNGKSVLSILLAAHATGKKVQFGESGCYSNFPSFTYAIVTEL